MFRKRPSAPPPMTACARKRRRATVVTSDAGTGASSSPWASLPEDLVRQIAWRVLAGDLLDYVRFRAVCTGWRSSTVCPRGRSVTDPRFHPRRWMMLPEGHGLHPGHYRLGEYIRFFNLDTGTFVRAWLRLFRNHCILDSVDGLLLLQRDEDTAIRLLHPFTGDIAELPPLATLLTQLENNDLPPAHPDPELNRWFHIRRGICASVSCNAGITTVMLAFHRLTRLAFATTQDRQWNLTSWEVPHNVGPLSFHGKLYVVRYPAPDGASQVFQMDPPLRGEGCLGSCHPPPPRLVAKCPADLHYPLYLVECDSDILVVGHTDISYSHILVYKLADLMLGRFVPVTSIGDRALFINERTLSVSSKGLPTVMAETVVYTDPRENRCKQYHLSTGTWSPSIDECGLGGFNPGPCSLIHHIMSCCFRSVWNKGLLYSEKEYSKPGWLLWKVKRKFRHWS